jgi:hypothetical protein
MVSANTRLRRIIPRRASMRSIVYCSSLICMFTLHCVPSHCWVLNKRFSLVYLDEVELSVFRNVVQGVPVLDRTLRKAYGR